MSLPRTREMSLTSKEILMMTSVLVYRLWRAIDPSVPI